MLMHEVIGGNCVIGFGGFTKFWHITGFGDSMYFETSIRVFIVTGFKGFTGVLLNLTYLILLI